MIIEENPFLRTGIRATLEKEDGIEVIGDSRPGEEALVEVERLRPDIVLMGLMWLDHDPAVFCREVTERVASTRVLALSFQNREEDMLIAILSNASGYVSQNAERPELARAIGMVNDGGGYFDWETARRVIERIQNSEDRGPIEPIPDVLSNREATILRMVGEDYDNSEIGERLSIASTTARNNVHRILRKLGVASRLRLVSFAARRGILLSGDELADGSSD